MRIELANILASENKDKNALLIEQYEALEEQLIFFNEKLNQLKRKLLESAVGNNPVLKKDIKTLEIYIHTLEAYLEVIQSGSILSFKTKKMSENDLLILDAQVKGIQKMRALITISEDQNVASQPSDKLSQLIADAEKQAYNVTRTRVWVRRGVNLLAGLVAAVAVVVVVAFMMTPAGHITLAVAGVVIALRAAAAFFGIGKAPIAHAHLSVGPFPVDISTPVPSNVAAVAPAFFGAALVRKLRITNPPREEAARNMQAATINKLADALNKKMSSIQDSGVKTFLLKVVASADKMYNDGVGSWFYESQKSKMDKGRLILSEVARIVENGVPETVGALLNLNVNSTQYTFGQLLNAQRNASFFSNRTSTIAENCGVKVDERQAVDLTKFVAALIIV